MSFINGDDGQVLVGAQVIAQTRGFTLNLTGDRIETTVQNVPNKTYLAGKNDVSGSIDALFDPTDTTGQDAIQQGNDVTLVLRPGGTGTGLPEWTGPATIVGEVVESAVGAAVTRQFDYAANGAWTRSTQS